MTRMMTRSSAAEAKQDNKCITPGCSFYQVSTQHYLCSGCSDKSTIQPYGLLAVTTPGSSSFGLATEVHVRELLMIPSLSHVGTIVGLWNYMLTKRVLVSPQQALKVLARIQARVQHYDFYSELFQRMVLCLCYEPGTCVMLEKTWFKPVVVCYFGHHGECFLSTKEAAEYFSSRLGRLRNSLVMTQVVQHSPQQ